MEKPKKKHLQPQATLGERKHTVKRLASELPWMLISMAARASAPLLMHAETESKLERIDTAVKILCRVGIFIKQRLWLHTFSVLCFVSSVCCCQCRPTYQIEFAGRNEFVEELLALGFHQLVNGLVFFGALVLFENTITWYQCWQYISESES
jgi:hypothetical protein